MGENGNNLPTCQIASLLGDTNADRSEGKSALYLWSEKLKMMLSKTQFYRQRDSYQQCHFSLQIGTLLTALQEVTEMDKGEWF